MEIIQLARRLAELGQTQEAQQAYFLVLKNESGKNPTLEFEAANYIFFSKGNYRVAYTAFVSLYNRGYYQDRILEIIIQGFYVPNLKKQQVLYEKNRAKFERYPYLFRHDFLEFEDLPIIFIPFNDEGYIPFYKNENRFGEYVNFNRPVIDRYFFKDLEKPVLAEDVYSQYQLEYLNDNVRESMWIARENHIYLHYTDWEVFCAYLACLDFRKMLASKKFVFLIEDEVSQYPIDFKERFGIDYSQYEVKPLGIREINRLIWHTQLSAHNGGDFFNEILYGHPNLIAYESLMFDNTLKTANEFYNVVRNRKKGERFIDETLRAISDLPNPTLKDCFLAVFLSMKDNSMKNVDPASRIVPALLYQPHFKNISYNISRLPTTGESVLHSEEYDRIKNSPVFTGFRYIKTFTPLRRFTSSYGATIRFMVKQINEKKSDEEKKGAVNDVFLNKVLNRSFMIDDYDRLYKDSILVRFEDGKLNPTATFTSLAEFLDIPYTESMTYCSGATGINPESMKGNDLGFDPAAIYRTYDEFTNDADRALIEYLLRDAYEYYGYDFHYYHGETVDSDWVNEQLDHIDHLDQLICQTIAEVCYTAIKKIVTDKTDETTVRELANKEGENILKQFRENRQNAIEKLLSGLHFVNIKGQPLHMMPMLKLDPALLEQPLYH